MSDEQYEKLTDKQVKDQAQQIIAANFGEGEQAGVVLKEMHDSLRAGGFSKFQALWITAAVLSGATAIDDKEIDEP
jgi:hypothetical protein